MNGFDTKNEWEWYNNWGRVLVEWRRTIKRMNESDQQISENDLKTDSENDVEWKTQLECVKEIMRDR